MYFQLLPLPVILSGVLLGESLAVLQTATNNQSFGDEPPKRHKLEMETLNEAEEISGEQINKYGSKSVSEEKWREVFLGAQLRIVMRQNEKHFLAQKQVL